MKLIFLLSDIQFSGQIHSPMDRGSVTEDSVLQAYCGTLERGSKVA
jgi:hypothetical protein